MHPFYKSYMCFYVVVFFFEIKIVFMGALTSKSYAFTGRPWENNSFESVDILNGFCSNIIVESRGVSIMRVLPKYSEDYSAWLPDRIRVVYDALNYSKVTTPYLRLNRGYVSLPWNYASNILLKILLFLSMKNLSLLNFRFSYNYKILFFKKTFLKLLRNFGFSFFKESTLKFFASLNNLK